MLAMIDPTLRLRRAIHLNDLILVRRIVRGNPDVLRSPDQGHGDGQGDWGNTNLHLAARLGSREVVRFLVESGHEDEGISKNGLGNTPLMEAVDSGHEDAAGYLARMFARCIDWKNTAGVDALMIASRSGLPDTISLFLTLHPSPLTLLSAVDMEGNTALHYASGYGQVQCLRVLLTAGADAMAENNFRCTPAMGSRSKDASTYFLSLVREIEVRKLEGREREKELSRRREGGVRVVSHSGSIGQALGGEEEDDSEEEDDDEEDGEEGVGEEDGDEEEDDEYQDSETTILEQPPTRAVFGSVDSGRQSPARIRRGDGWGVFGSSNRSRTGSGTDQ